MQCKRGRGGLSVSLLEFGFVMTDGLHCLPVLFGDKLYKSGAAIIVVIMSEPEAIQSSRYPFCSFSLITCVCLFVAWA